MRVFALLLGAWLCLLAGCGGGSSSSGQAVAITISPISPSLAPGGTQAFTANITNTGNTAVTWSVQEGATGGSVTTAGLYTAPAAAGTYHVVATSQADTSKTAVATVTVTLNVAVNVSPDTATVLSGQDKTFTAAVIGTANTAVTWSVLEGGVGGSITGAGVYTAPSTAGTYHVIATSQADSTKTGSATVTVSVVDVAVSPKIATLTAGQNQTFTAAVTGTPNTAVTWFVSGGAAAGSVTSAGVYTAPALAGTYNVVAASQADPTKIGTVTVIVNVAVAIAPTSATLTLGQSQTFAATVTGSANTDVRWSVQEGAAGGSITAAGLYTAPATAGTYHVVAISQADSLQTAVVTIIVRSGGASIVIK
jgi:hypothetical protein